MLCRMHRDQIKLADHAIARLDTQIAAMAATRWQRELDLLITIPGFGAVVAAVWLAEIGPAPHQWFSSHDKLAAWASLCPGNHISAGKRKSGRTGDAGTYIKPALIEAAWGAIRPRGRLQARYRRLVRRFGGDKNPGAKKKAITAIAHTLLKIAYQVLKTGTPYTDPGADFYTRRDTAARQQAWLIRRLESLNPGATITITPPPAAAADPPPAAGPGAPPGTHAALTRA
jgi:transposase